MRKDAVRLKRRISPFEELLLTSRDGDDECETGAVSVINETLSEYVTVGELDCD